MTSTHAPVPDQCRPKIPDEQFNLSYDSERKLYSRLILDLGRAPEESMQVMGFLMWLQSEICPEMGLVVKLLELSGDVINEIAKESVACLKCVQSDIMPFTDGVCEIFMLPELVNTNISLELLHQHRFSVINGVKEIVNDVCVRAFKDILDKVSRGKFAASYAGSSGNVGGQNTVAKAARASEVDSSHYHGKILATFVADKVGNPSSGDGRSLTAAIGNEPGGFNGGQVSASYSGNNVGNDGHGINFITETDDENCSMNQLRRIFKPLNSNRFGNINGSDETKTNFSAERGTSDQLGSLNPFPYGASYQQAAISYPFFPSADDQAHQSWAAHGSANAYGIPPSAQYDYMSYRLNALCSPQYFSPSIDDMLPDDRTVFLTFSKGYPVSALEVGEFFTRKFGDYIEAIYMQNVRPNEQVLYARMVCSTASIVDVIIEGGKAKYNINGRHVWARKYVKKH